MLTTRGAAARRSGLPESGTAGGCLCGACSDSIHHLCIACCLLLIVHCWLRVAGEVLLALCPLTMGLQLKDGEGENRTRAGGTA